MGSEGAMSAATSRHCERVKARAKAAPECARQYRHVVVQVLSKKV
jgi:hypothetical protein